MKRDITQDESSIKTIHNSSRMTYIPFLETETIRPKRYTASFEKTYRFYQENEIDKENNLSFRDQKNETDFHNILQQQSYPPLKVIQIDDCKLFF